MSYWIVTAMGVFLGWTLAWAWYKQAAYRRGYWDGKNGMPFNVDGD